MTKETCSNCTLNKSCQCSICSVVDDKCNRNACPITSFCKHKDKPLDLFGDLKMNKETCLDLFGDLKGKK